MPSSTKETSRHGRTTANLAPWLFQRYAILNQTCLGCSAAHVKRKHLIQAGFARQPCGGQHASSWARLDHIRRSPPCSLSTHDATIRLHDEKPPTVGGEMLL